MPSQEAETRLKEILEIARELGWYNRQMGIEEVEKCMLAMADDAQLAQLRSFKKLRSEVTA